MRVGLAILSGILCAFLRLGLVGMTVGAGMYMVSYLLTRYVVKIDDDLEYETYLLGLGTYVVTWITFWILLHTLLRSI